MSYRSNGRAYQLQYEVSHYNHSDGNQPIIEWQTQDLKSTTPEEARKEALELLKGIYCTRARIIEVFTVIELEIPKESGYGDAGG